jgi:hypothetical protein
MAVSQRGIGKFKDKETIFAFPFLFEGDVFLE